MAKPPLPQIYCDVHIKPGAIEAFTELAFKCIRIPESEYRGIDEKGFIRYLYAKGALFATGDLEFTEYVRENNVKHAGIIEILPDLNNEEAHWAADGLAKVAKVHIKGLGKHALRKHILYFNNDGVRITDDKSDDSLFYSWEAIERDLGTPEY
jgi:hypothetical protein